MALRSAEDYRAQLLQLLPPGPAWDPDLYPLPARIVDAVSAELVRVDSRANDLLNEMFPGTINELLTDWERVMGLPDVCLGESASFADRRKDVVRRFSEDRRSDGAYFEELAARFGYEDAWVEEWRAPRFGRSRFGSAHFGTWSAQFVWVLHLEKRLAGRVRFGFSQFGTRFGVNPNDAVECLVRHYAPAHTLVLFDYS